MFIYLCDNNLSWKRVEFHLIFILYKHDRDKHCGCLGQNGNVVITLHGR